MPVVLLDPSRPDMVPAGAVGLMSGTIAVTEEVHPNLLWQLPDYVLVGDRAQNFDVLVSSDKRHPAVRARIDAGERVVEGEPVKGSTILRAVDLMDRLRRTGPWEQRQTHDSLRRYLVEEVYELLDAIDNGSRDELKSELGDLLLQVLFHSRIAADAIDGFDIDDVAQSFVDKVSYRTPGVLGGEHADLERQINEWEAAKAAEREAQRGSVLDGIVTTQPALALTQKIFERLAGADFPIAAVSPSLYQVGVPFRKHATVSVEDEQRRRAIILMDQVRAAEAAASGDGVWLTDANTWRKYLGMDYDENAFDDDLDTGEIPVIAEDEWIVSSLDEEGEDDADYEEVAVDADPIDSDNESERSRVSDVKVRKDVPGIVVVEKWSAEEE
ncbi:MazG family protein [Gordonia liuliyuniae]|uniref:MazG family protein n=1 Tax=Gordonia liuliyuniae TaxID=2911517 RepID=A0ABS9IY64_9ACTN|nr:MazG family protein [Gordonia liuliyuniae]MCF8590441.1 MazG family protein [Gordonia liuliyuniae]